MKRTKILILFDITMLASFAILQLFSQPTIIVGEFELPEDGLSMESQRCAGGGTYLRCWPPGAGCMLWIKQYVRKVRQLY